MSSFSTPDESVEDTVASLLDSDANHVLAYDDSSDRLTISLSNSVSTTSLETDSVTFNQDITDSEGNTVTDLPDPVRVTEEASTFTESEINVSLTNTDISNGSIGLTNETNGTTATVKSDTYNLTGTQSDRRGIVVNPNNNLYGIRAKLALDSSGSSAYLVDDSDGTVLDSVDISSYSGGDMVSFFGDLNSGNKYRVVIDGDGNGYSNSYEEAYYPYTSTDVDIVLGASGGSTNDVYAYNFVNATAVFPPETSGNALVEWDSAVPADIDSWDLATFQRTLDSETVTIDVEDSNGTVLKSDISKDTDISDIGTSTDVQLRANFSRNDTANNPTLDYLSRRFTR